MLSTANALFTPASASAYAFWPALLWFACPSLARLKNITVVTVIVSTNMIPIAITSAIPRSS